MTPQTEFGLSVVTRVKAFVDSTPKEGLCFIGLISGNPSLHFETETDSSVSDFNWQLETFRASRIILQKTGK
jgi:hypothetical protein